MIGLRLLLIAVALATVAYVWNTSSHVPVVSNVEPTYDYIIGSGLKYLLQMSHLHNGNTVFIAYNWMKFFSVAAFQCVIWHLIRNTFMAFGT